MPDERVDALMKEIKSLDEQSREQLGLSFVRGLDRPQRGSFVRSVIEGLSDEASVETVLNGVQTLPSRSRVSVLRQSAAQLTQEERRAVVEGLTPPTDTKGLWLIVVLAFAVVLVGSFGAIAAGMFIPLPEHASVKPELALSMFTSVVGFLAGLFIPSPANKKGPA
jgi:hypothetical protein